MSRERTWRKKGAYRFVLFTLLMGIFLWSPAFGETLRSATPFSLLPHLRVASPLTFCNERVPLKRQETRERFEKELMLTLWDRPQVLLWLKRSHRYLPTIESLLKQNQLPDDLKYVAIAESALRPHAGSQKGAVGFWQFMAETGRRYGLIINARRDERRNVVFSTEAAIRYFRDLHREFGSWTLAAAAFNMGEEGLLAEILEQNTQDYYKLYLPLETQRFLFRLISIKLIFEDPVKYGFRLTKKDYYPPVSSERVKITCFQETPIRIIARAAQTYFKRIKDLNPEIRGHFVAPGSHLLLIPKAGRHGFQDRYQQYVKKFLETRKERVYVVMEGDNLSSIAARFDIPLQALLIWNQLDLERPIHPGDRLFIYPRKGSPSLKRLD
jgi:membrane-bound lytic murein transglycosylase D